MSSITPSERIRQQIRDLLRHGLETSEDLSTLLLRLETELLLQEMPEQEVTDYLGREPSGLPQRV